jgi:hypothetical protein
MKYRFLIHSLNHTILAVDISAIGLPTTTLSVVGKTQDVPSTRFTTWDNAAKHFAALGANLKAIETAREHLKKGSVAVLTVV